MLGLTEMDLIPPKKPKTQATTVHIPADLRDEVDAILEEIRKAGEDPTLSRNDLLVHWIRRSVEEYREKQKASKKR